MNDIERTIPAASTPVGRTDTAPMKRVELHLHTQMSAMNGLCDPQQAIRQAAAWGMPAIAITDHGVVQAFPIAARTGVDIKVIFGMEGYYVNDVDDNRCHESQKPDKDIPVHHISILVKNRVGLKNLYQLVSESHLEHYSKAPIIPKSLLMQHREGLIIGSACEAGELMRAVVSHRDTDDLKQIGRFYDYLEIMPTANNAFMLENGQAKSVDELRDFNRRILALGDELHIPVCATGDVHFIEPEDELARHVLLNAQGFSDADDDMPLYFRTTDEMLEEFAYLGEERAYEVVVKNTNLIADMVEGQVELLPRNHLCTPKLENSDTQLRDLVYSRMNELYGENPDKLICDRVEREMDAILSHHSDVLYITARKLVEDSKAHGHPVGYRGSIGSSLVAYLSGITETNPLPAHYLCPKCHYTDFESGQDYDCGADMSDKSCPICGTKLRKEGFNLPFATFFGIDGSKVPDIDLNFTKEYQANACAYLKDLFGEDHVIRVGTISTISETTANSFVTKYAEERGLQFTQTETNRLVQSIMGVKHSMGMFPGGFVIIPQDMDATDFFPIQRSSYDSAVITTHLEYYFAESSLLKLDLLRHDSLSMIRILERLTETKSSEIPLDDPETLRVFSSPKALGLPEDDPIIGKNGTIGIPEFEMVFVRKMLAEAQPEGFDALTRLSGFLRSAGSWSTKVYYLIMSGSIGVSEIIGSRDDIMLYLMDKGIDEETAFQIMDNVRRFKRHPTDEQVHTMVEHGVPQWYIDACNEIDYLYPKAHIAAYYVMTAFRIAWYKVHHPLAFYSALFYMRDSKGFFGTEVLPSDIQKVKRRLKQIQENHNSILFERELTSTLKSVYEFYLRGFDFAPSDRQKSDSAFFIPEGDKTLRIPSDTVSGIREILATFGSTPGD